MPTAPPSTPTAVLPSGAGSLPPGARLPSIRGRKLGPPPPCIALRCWSSHHQPRQDLRPSDVSPPLQARPPSSRSFGAVRMRGHCLSDLPALHHHPSRAVKRTRSATGHPSAGSRCLHPALQPVGVPCSKLRRSVWWLRSMPPPDLEQHGSPHHHPPSPSQVSAYPSPPLPAELPLRVQSRRVKFLAQIC